MPVVPTPISVSPVDLISGTFATEALAAGGIALTTAQANILPTLITAASREIIRYCGRQFALTAYDEILTPEGGRQDRGEPASVQLSYFPVVEVSRVATGRSSALTIANRDPATNQLASVVFAMTGDVEYNDLTYSGLNLTRTASGVVTTNSCSFTDSATIDALAAAINALGGGWKAMVAASGTPAFGLFAPNELVGVREPKNAFSPGVTLDVFTQAASSYDIDRPTGIMRCYGCAGAGGNGGWGPAFGSPYDGLGEWGGGALGLSQYRVTYTAGFSTVPESVQQVCAEVVKASFERLKTDSTLQSETTGNYTWTARETIATLPDWAIQVLTYYRDHWI